MFLKGLGLVGILIGVCVLTGLFAAIRAFTDWRVLDNGWIGTIVIVLPALIVAEKLLENRGSD